MLTTVTYEIGDYVKVGPYGSGAAFTDFPCRPDGGVEGTITSISYNADAGAQWFNLNDGPYTYSTNVRTVELIEVPQRPLPAVGDYVHVWGERYDVPTDHHGTVLIVHPWDGDHSAGFSISSEDNGLHEYFYDSVKSGTVQWEVLLKPARKFYLQIVVTEEELIALRKRDFGTYALGVVGERSPRSDAIQKLIIAAKAAWL